jgi:transcriptional regulator with XRE-family HTH domain
LLGKGIRAERISRGLTLSQLGELTGLSVSALSQIENDVYDPSIGSLRRVARALDVPIFRFLADGEDTDPVVRRDQRRKLIFAKSAITYEALTPGTPATLEMFNIKLDPGGTSAAEPFSHPSDECLLVLQGELTVEMNGETYQLAPGDSMYIQRGTLHLVRNTGAEPAEIVFALSPPVF